MYAESAKTITEDTRLFLRASTCTVQKRPAKFGTEQVFPVPNEYKQITARSQEFFSGDAGMGCGRMVRIPPGYGPLEAKMKAITINETWISEIIPLIIRRCVANNCEKDPSGMANVSDPEAILYEG
uniref:Uncharacterized protein n=1 Tax=Romanomermis culicivorax TaxID=13658 RepID=A0A915JFK2_ROMCU